MARYLMIAWVLIIITLSSIPNIPTIKIHTPSREIRLDYLIHFTEYGFLAFVTFLAFAGNGFRIPVRKGILLTVSLILFALADEFHQKLIPGRSFNVNDIYSNISGIILTTVFMVVVLRVIARGTFSKVLFNRKVRKGGAKYAKSKH
jgi:VanZ family protein